MSVLDGATRRVSWHVLGFLVCFGGVAYSHAKSVGPETKKNKKERKKDWDNVGKIRAFFLVPFSQEVINMLVLHIMYLVLYMYIYVCMYVLGINMKQS